MGEYADARSSKMVRFLEGLVRKNPKLLELRSGRHQSVIKHLFGKGSYPVPTSHRWVNKYIVKDLSELLIGWGVCTKEDFDKAIK